MCRRFNIELSGGGKRTTLCSRLKAIKNRKTQANEHQVQDESVRQLNPGRARSRRRPKLAGRKSKKELTDLIQASVQSAIGEAVPKTTEHVLAVVRPDSIVTNEDHNKTDTEKQADPPSAPKSTEPQPEQMETHGTNLFETSVFTQPSYQVPMAPQTISNSNQSKNTSNEILGKLNDLATQLQTLGQSVFQQITPPVINLPTPPEGPSGTANPPSQLSALGSLNPNTTIRENIKREVLSSEFFELCKLLPKNLPNFHKDNKPVEISLNDNTLKNTRPKTKKMITTIEEWLTAFGYYMGIIIEKFPERAQELIQYFMTIHYAANNTTGHAWVVYDSQFPTQAADNRNLNWGHIDMQLWVKIFCVAPSCLREEYSICEHGPRLQGTRGAGTSFQFNRACVICKR